MSAPKAGDRINNFLLEELIGTGSFGQVWRARHHVFGERVAIKIPTDSRYVQNLRLEGVAIHGLRHANIVRALDLDPYGDPPYFIMELVDGPSLRQVIDAHPSGMPIAASTAVMRGMLQALTAAHAAGLIHRDIKPANVLLASKMEELPRLSEAAVKVADFGLGRAGGITAASIMQSGSLLTEDGRSISGTLAYMSPEQKEGKDIDARSDLYSCGIVLFEMLTGERPSGSDMPSSIRSEVPGYLDDVFRRCYTRLDRRFVSAEQVLTALQRHPPMVPRMVQTEVGLSCPSCRSPVQRRDQFCIHCGAQLVDAVPRCAACRAYVHHTDRFCIFCGNDLRVKTA